MTDSEGRPWDWHDDADDVIVPDQPPVACYVNPKGAVVLRQRDDWPSDDDPIIWFAVEHAFAVAMAILQAAGLDATALAPEPPQACTGPGENGAAGLHRNSGKGGAGMP